MIYFVLKVYSIKMIGIVIIGVIILFIKIKDKPKAIGVVEIVSPYNELDRDNTLFIVHSTKT